MIPAQQQNFLPSQEALLEGGPPLSKAGWYLLLSLWQRTGSGPGTPTVGAGLTATGATAATALELGDDINEITTVPSGGGVKLAITQPGEAQWVFNNQGSFSLTVYAPTGSEIDSNPSYSLATNKAQIFTCIAAGEILSLQLG